MKNFKTYDVFKSFLVEDAEYDGYIEIPKIKTSDLIPEKVVTFSKEMKKSFKDFDCWVMFYEHDKEFERLWHNPRQYLPKLKSLRELYRLISAFTETCLYACRCGTHTEVEHLHIGCRKTELRLSRM